MVDGRFLLVLCSLSLVGVATAEVFSSTAHLAGVLNTERQVVGLLEGFIRDTEAKIGRLRSYINDFDNTQTANGIDDAVANPLHAYQLLKRLIIDWGHIEKFLYHDNSWQDLLQQVQEHRQGLLMPHETDLQGAALALVRLQETYRLNASDLARGDILGIQSHVGLNARDCFYLGKHSFHQGYLNLAIEWFDHALREAREDNNNTVMPEEILPFLEQAINAQDEADARKSINIAYYEGFSQVEEETKSYQALCRGEKLRKPEVESKLFCHLSNRDDPYFYLNPIKVEVHSLDPSIVTFHDIIYDSEINYIKEFSKPLLERSTVLGNDGAAREVSSVRTSQNTWLTDNVQNEESQFVLGRLMNRINHVTHLTVMGEDNSEAMQVANYGIGGHYDPHHDYLLKDKTPEQLSNIPPHESAFGDRIATLMFYLSDVERGGATVFPRIGASVWPKKGSAVFWYNLRQSGAPDPLTLHGACPVLHGSKWVGNKWIRELNQALYRPCGLHQHE